jgi:uncharacterized protein (TIGR03790 family)
MFENFVGLIGGNEVFRSNLEDSISQTSATAGDAQQLQLQFLRGRIDMARESLAILEMIPASLERDTAILAVVERAQGIIGTISWIDRALAATALNETDAAFDSELALIRWEPDYRLHQAQPNFLRSGNDQLQLSRKYATTMVSRLDGSSADAARKLVEGALTAERQGGLKGKFYLDARGLEKEGSTGATLPPVYLQFEKSLLAAGNLVRQTGVLSVTADEEPALFQAGDSCTDAALYCGWYSLGKYVDAFEFVPGAIGYHLSTIEAAGLREDAGTDAVGWCRGLVDDGVAVSLGAVKESGLAALPLPSEFFGQLISEHATVGEAYWRSVPNTSWYVILIGDPLYRPFE